MKRITQATALMLCFLLLGSCKRTASAVPFTTAFGAITLPSKGIKADALQVPGRDLIRYGRLEGPEAVIRGVLAKHGADIRRDSERAEYRLDGIRGVADTIEGFPGHWLSSGETALECGHVGDFEVILCSRPDRTFIAYLTDVDP